jgi:hypothetical protein
MFRISRRPTNSIAGNGLNSVTQFHPVPERAGLQNPIQLGSKQALTETG